MRILALDPSEKHVGIVLVDSDTITTSLTQTVQETIRWLRSMTPAPTIVLLERPAQGPRADSGTIAAWKALEWTAETLFPNLRVVNVGPGEWKPFIRSQKPDLPEILKTQHEKDAYSLYLYWRRFCEIHLKSQFWEADLLLRTRFELVAM